MPAAKLCALHCAEHQQNHERDSPANNLLRFKTGSIAHDHVHAYTNNSRMHQRRSQAKCFANYRVAHVCTAPTLLSTSDTANAGPARTISSESISTTQDCTVQPTPILVATGCMHFGVPLKMSPRVRWMRSMTAVP